MENLSFSIFYFLFSILGGYSVGGDFGSSSYLIDGILLLELSELFPKSNNFSISIFIFRRSSGGITFGIETIDLCKVTVSTDWLLLLEILICLFLS
jgi:hypothetical protein